jgi:hypothetical protein
MKKSRLTMICITLLVSHCLNGCIASSVTPSLDRVLDESVVRILESGSVSVETDNVPIGTPGFSGYQCFEPMFYVISLGLIPAHCRYSYLLTVVIEEEGNVRTIEFPYRVTSMQGWLMALYPLFPDWVIGSYGRAEERARNTVLNRELRSLP